MSPRLVVCMIASIAAGAVAFAWTLAAGAGILLAVLAYSLVGSFSLVATTGVAAILERPVPRLAAARAPAYAAATAHTG